MWIKTSDNKNSYKDIQLLGAQAGGGGGGGGDPSMRNMLAGRRIVPLAICFLYSGLYLSLAL